MNEQWGDPRYYITDDRDLPEERQRRLIINQGGNGDWYVGVDTLTGEGLLNHVRLSTSGGAASEVPGLTWAIVDAYRALGGERSSDTSTVLYEALKALAAAVSAPKDTALRRQVGEALMKYEMEHSIHG